MLVLTSRCGDEIVLTDGDVAVIIKLVEVDRGEVRFGLTAPRSMTITRRKHHTDEEWSELEKKAGE